MSVPSYLPEPVSWKDTDSDDSHGVVSHRNGGGMTGNHGAQESAATERAGFAASNLTRGQLQIWMGQKLLPEEPIYHLAVGLNVRGEIDPVRFAAAFQVLVRSSDALRTVVEERDGVPAQRVLSDSPNAMPLIDLSGESDPGSAARNWMRERCQKPLAWQQRLFDAALIKLSVDQFIWYLNVHHLVCDGWSFELIYRQMGELYRLALAGRLPPKIDLLPYADFVAHERAHRRSARHSRSEAFWKERLAEGGDRMEFYGRSPAKKTIDVCRISWALGPERTGKLRAALPASADTEQASLLQGFAAITVAYLHLLNGKSRYSIGIPFHNRRSKRFKETIGFFSEVLPILLEVSEDETFLSLMGKMKTELFTAARHGQYSPANSYFRKAYEVVLNYHTRSFCDFAGMPALPEWVHTGRGDDALAIQIRDFAASSSLVVDFDWHREVFEESDGERVVGHFARVLDAFLADPERPLRELTLMSPEETRAVLQRGDGGAAPAESRPIHELIEQRAELQPEAVAVVFEDRKLSYGELDRRANQVGRYLRDRGVGAGAIVGLYVERSFEMVIGLLGILKSGAAYVPISSEFSPAWVRFVLQDTDAALLLTQERLRDRLPPAGPPVVYLDGPNETLFRERSEIIEGRTAAQDLAYVIYTSGSTGTPKGVEVTHGALANFAVQAGALFGLERSDRVLQFASIAFDTSIEEIVPCLLRGGAVVLRSDEMLVSPAAFLAQCAEWGITVLDLPTVYWHELSAALAAERLPIPESLRLVIIGGEKASAQGLALWRASVNPKVRLLNTYGPTEATVAATFFDLTGHAAGSRREEDPPIGRSFPNVRTYVLDRNRQPVPVGVAGELWIGGAGVARGYRNQPALTEQAFFPDPFSANAGARLYRTGDLVRLRRDGNLEFLGRRDRQVKLRGFRVELESVESVLKKHPLVADAAVLHDPDAAPQSLIAYLLAKDGAVLNEAEIRNFARSKLADYMVPAKVVMLDSLPLTHSGKVNLRALAATARARPRWRPIDPPRTPTENRVAEIWRGVLGAEQIGRSDHFFDVGGQSLLAAQIVSRIRTNLGIEIPLRLIFEAPRLADLAARIDEISRRRGDLARSLSAVHPAADDGAPVSQSQARIWYMQQLAPESAAYNIAAPIRFAGTLRKEALRRSLEELVRRHDSLRALFRNRGGEPVQVILPTVSIALPEIDLRETPEDRRLAESRRILGEEAARPFDLEAGPLFRTLLVRLGDEDHVLLLNMHHVISDQWSLGVIARELTALYNGFCNSGPPPENGRGPRYVDFATWQDRHLSGESLEAQLAYWRGQLADLEPASLPADRPRPAVQTFRGAYQSLDLSSEFVEKLARQAARENASLYMIFLTAFKALLSRYCGRHDIALGSPVANRSRLEWEGVVGTFINIVVLRTDLGNDPTLRQALRKVRGVVLDAFSHQDVSFETLVKELQPERDPSRSPLIQVLFNFQSVPLPGESLNDLSWSAFEIDHTSSQFDLSVTVDPEISRKIRIAYNTDLYDEETIGRLLRHYRRMLEAAAKDPDQPIAAVCLLDQDERQRILCEWNDTAAVVPPSCVYELFEAHAAQVPDAVAVEFGDQRVSYRDLERRADQVAQRLQALNIEPQALIGVCLERSADLIATLLGVWKAGGAYVPIDPAYPRERIAFMLEDSGIAALITEKKLLGSLPPGGHATLCLDRIGRESLSAPTAIRRPSLPNDLAYVIYTSGSTGRPKGVAVEHRSLVNFLNSMSKAPGLTERDVLLSVTTISFDIAALELFLPLVAGARVVIASREIAADGRRLAEELAARRATIMQATPATWRMLTEAGWKGFEGFKVLCGGEAFPPELAPRLLENGNAVWNLYGPTETTVWSTVCRIEAPGAPISIGRPIDNTRLYILDRHRHPVPIGVPGELYIGGRGVARGYWNRPELTAEKFVPDPYCAEENARLFKTGDLARYRPDGNVECLGRLDHQIKIRGHRIEIGEIEAALAEHPAVRQAVVVGWEQRRGEKGLVAYLSGREKGKLDSETLRGYLARRLPDYMIPSAFIFLDKMPLTPGGKVNRQALPKPDAAGNNPVRSRVQPRDRLEFQLARIWKAVLDIQAVGVTENFFALGGHSLIAVRLVARIEEELGVRLGVNALFKAPTIERLASLVRDEGWRPPKNCLVEINSAGSKPPLFLVHDGYSALARHLGEDQPVYSLSLLGLLDQEIPRMGLEDIAARYVESVMALDSTGPYYIGGYSAAGLIALEMARQLQEDHRRATVLFLLDTYGPDSRPVPIGKRLFDHVRVLRRMHLVEKLGYGRTRARNLREKATRVLWRFARALFGKTDAPLALNGFNLKMMYFDAVDEYMPRGFAGRTILFRTAEGRIGFEADPNLGWTGILRGEIRVREIPGNHGNLLDEPYVRGVAARLSECLRHGQIEGGEGS